LFEHQLKYAEVLLPVPLNRTFTYAISDDSAGAVVPGMRVVVPFGKRRVLTGIIINIHDEGPQDYEAKPVSELLDEAPVVTAQQLELIHWIASYYMCTAGEVLNAALPSGLKLSSESKIQLHPGFEEHEHDFSDTEQLVIDTLSKKHTLSYADVAAIAGIGQAGKLIKSLDRKNAITIYEEIKEKYSPKTEKHIRLAPEYESEKALEALFETLAKKPKQEEVLLAFLQESGLGNTGKKSVLKKSLKEKQVSMSSLATLIKHNVLEEYEVVISRFTPIENVTEAPELSDIQQAAFEELLHQFENKEQVLLHGITGSGKTAMYIKLIQHMLENGHQALLLLPEIALTTQIVERLQRVFGDQMGVYHSKFSENERVEVWKGVLTGEFPVVVGVRSSLFLPFDNLGLIIIDEEHETSYKQYEPAPRYHARDTALMLAHIHHAKALMGTATPSIETYFLAEGEKYGLVNLDQRYGEAELPEIKAIDFGKAMKKKMVKGNFSNEVIEEIEKVTAAKKQVIMFQNRRGYAPFLECQNCGHVPKCINCAVSLTYHQYQQHLRCHYCGYHEKMPTECEECNSTLLKTMGFGTEKLEEDLQLLLPNVRIQRMDLETTRAKHSYQRIIENFAEGKTDILIGTQMVTKGLDFENVALVCIIDFDRMMHFPDFRSYERTFDLTLQVSGRAGRSKTTGKVLVQTYNPDQHIFTLLKKADYTGFYHRELSERARFSYPPYTRLIKITLKHRDQQTVIEGAKALVQELEKHYPPGTVLGPEAPMISRIKNKYLMDITLKLPRFGFNLGAAKETIRHEALLMQRHPIHRTIQVVFDVDPF
jgi:primosomal protein N' (replication factor Y)